MLEASNQASVEYVSPAGCTLSLAVTSPPFATAAIFGASSWPSCSCATILISAQVNFVRDEVPYIQRDVGIQRIQQLERQVDVRNKPPIGRLFCRLSLSQGAGVVSLVLPQVHHFRLQSQFDPGFFCPLQVDASGEIALAELQLEFAGVQRIPAS